LHHGINRFARFRICLAALAAMVVMVAGCGSSPPKLVSIGAGITGPKSLRATVYATGLKHAAAFAFDAEGRLWVATADYSDEGKDAVYLVAEKGARPVKVVSGLHTPLGLLWYRGALYVASTGRVDAYSNLDSRGAKFASRRTIVTLPSKVGESNNLVLASNGRMLLGISSPCDHCTSTTSKLSAAIISFRPDGTDVRVFASGIRAAVGLIYYPGTNDLFVSMNQRDDLGARTPGDWLAVVKEGQDWKFPACYGQRGTVCTGVPQPVGVLDEHAAAAGVAIVTGQLGADVGTAALVAEWSKGTVLQVALDKTDAGYVGTTTTMLSGVGSPVALIMTKSNTLLVGDWASGKIYEITRRSSNP
jgi:glucose/arabinose dehydrogenase